MGKHFNLHDDDAEMFLKNNLARYTMKDGWQLGHIRGSGTCAMKEWYSVDATDAATLSRVNKRLAEAPHGG